MTKYPRGREILVTGRDIWKWKNTIKNQEAVIDWKNSEIANLTAQVEELERRLTSCRLEITNLKSCDTIEKKGDIKMKIVEMNENDAIWSYEFWPTCEECGREIKNIKSGKWVWFQDRDDNPPTLLCNTCIVEEIKQINRRIHKNYPAKK